MKNFQHDHINHPIEVEIPAAEVIKLYDRAVSVGVITTND